MSTESKIKIPLLTSEDIEVKIKQITKAGALALLYKTARTDRKYLNLVYGPMNWTSDYKVIKDNLYCGIGVREDSNHEFVWKWDCGIESRSDEDGNEKKGEASDAFKRAGFQWGIGEELYSSPFIWLNVATKQNASQKWELENKFAKYVVTQIEFNEDTRVITKLVIANEDTNVVVYEWEMPTTGAVADKMVQTIPQKAKDTDKPVKVIPAPKTIIEKPVAPVKEQKVDESSNKQDVVEKLPLNVLINSIGKMVKVMKTQAGNIDQYTQILTNVTGQSNFRCNTATEDQYDLVLGIYTELKKLGYQI